MSTIIPQGEGPVLGPMSSGIEMLDPGAEVKMRNFPPSNLPMGVGNFVDLSIKNIKEKSEKKSKQFDDGPLPPLSPSQENGWLDTFKPPDLAVSKKSPFPVVSTSFTPGLVKRTGKEAACELAVGLLQLRKGTTGAIVEEGFEPVGDQYNEGVHFLVEKNLSKGSFGSVETCIDSGQDCKKFIRKKINKINFRSSEVTVPLNLNHENVTKLYGIIQRDEEEDDEDGVKIELLMENAGTALNTFTKKFEIDTQKIWHITKQVMSGLNHMHFYEMIHFDIKPENLIVQWEGNRLLVKITDFGSAKLPQERIEFIGWTPEYMAPETSQLFLQALGIPFARKIMDTDITGKIDVFAAALVVMFLYEKVHVLQRLITKGKASYADYDDDTRMAMQRNLMDMLARDPNFVQSIVPDKCDIDMREMLGMMTQYDPQNRFSAQDCINFIDRREKRREDAIIECRKKLQLQKIEKERERAQECRMMPIINALETEVPDIAYNCLETETGPIKMDTKDKLRQKLMPYPGKGKGKGKSVKEETPMQELKRIQAASKMMEDFQPPPTPVTDVSLSMAKLNMKNPVHTTERNALLVTQPMTDVASQRYIPNPRQGMSAGNRRIQQPSQQAEPSTTKVLPPQQPAIPPPVPVASTSIKVEPVTQSLAQNNQNVMELVQQLVKNGKLKIAMSEKGPVLVQLPDGCIPAAPISSGVVPCMPTEQNEPDLPMDMCSTDMGNVPDFLKLG